MNGEGGGVFDFAIVCYLFLGGLGGGLCAVASFAVLSIPAHCLRDSSVSDYAGLLGWAFSAAAAVLVLAGTVLLADAGISGALVHLFFPPSPNYLSVGSWFIVAATVLCAAMGMRWYAGRAYSRVAVLRTASVFAAVAGLGVAVYTGLFLSAMPAVALWNTAWLPALFVASSLSCGTVAFAAVMKATGASVRFRGFVSTLVKADIALVAAEAVCAVGLLAAAFGAGDGSAAHAASASASALIWGELAFAWWGAFFGLGVAGLAVFDILILRAQEGWSGRLWMVMGPTFCAFAGAFALRYCIIEAGMHPVLGF